MARCRIAATLAAAVAAASACPAEQVVDRAVDGMLLFGKTA